MGGESQRVKWTEDTVQLTNQTTLLGALNPISDPMDSTTNDLMSNKISPMQGETSTKDSTAPSSATKQLALEGDSDSDDEAFELLRSRKRKTKKKPKPTKSIPISISLPPSSRKDGQVDDEPKEDKLPPAAVQYPINDIVEEKEEICYDFDLEDPESEEEQVEEPPPPVEDFQTTLAKLRAEKDADLAKIKAFLKAKWAERNEEVQMEVMKIRGEMLAKQERQRTQLAENHRRQLLADEKKVEEGKVLVSIKQVVSINFLATH
jgi:hypothetical protein